MQTVSFRQNFSFGAQSADTLQRATDEILTELAVPGSEAAIAAEAAGLHPTEFEASATIRESGQGFDPTLVTIAVGIASAAGSEVAKTLWNKVIWPRLCRRFGVDALGDPANPPDREQ